MDLSTKLKITAVMAAVLMAVIWARAGPRLKELVQVPWRRPSKPAVLTVHGLAAIVDAGGLGFRAIGEDVQELGQSSVAVLFHQLCHVVAAVAAAGFALDREGGDAEIREGMGVVAHGGEPVFGRVHHQLPSAPPPPEEPPPGSKLIGRTGGKGGSSGIGWW